MSQTDLDRVWEIIEDVAVCMVTTHAGGRMRSRTMHAILEREEGTIYFVTDTRGAKDDEIAAATDVCLAFADIGDNTYLTLLVETGIIGLAAVIALNCAVLLYAFRAARSASPLRSFCGTWMACFWAGQVVQMFSADLLTYWRVLPVYFFVLALAVREEAQ